MESLTQSIDPVEQEQIEEFIKQFEALAVGFRRGVVYVAVADAIAYQLATITDEGAGKLIYTLMKDIWNARTYYKGCADSTDNQARPRYT